MNAKDLHLIHDGQLAGEQLEMLNPVFEQCRQKAINAWIAADTVEERERQWMYVAALSNIRQHFTTRVQSGQIAQAFPMENTDGE
jgi:hypothetical protein